MLTVAVMVALASSVMSVVETSKPVEVTFDTTTLLLLDVTLTMLVATLYFSGVYTNV